MIPVELTSKGLIHNFPIAIYMSEREKVNKAYNQCFDALSGLDHRSIFKVFKLLSVQFELDSNVAGVEFVLSPQNESPKLPTATFLTTENADLPSKPRTQSNGARGKQSLSSSKSPKALNEFDFRPDGIIPLKEFFSLYAAKSNLEYNLIFIYWFQEKLKLNEITMNHVFTAYRHVGIKTPQIGQSLSDTKARKGWIESSNRDDLKVTRAGLNYIEHDMPKKNG